MSLDQQNAVLQEALDVSHQHRERMAIRHGLAGSPPRNTIGTKSPEPKIIEKIIERVAEKASDTISNATETATNMAQQAVKPRMSKWAKVAVVASGLGGAAAGGIGSYLANDRETVTVIEETQIKHDPDLILWLRKNGYHLPPTNNE